VCLYVVSNSQKGEQQCLWNVQVPSKMNDHVSLFCVEAAHLKEHDNELKKPGHGIMPVDALSVAAQGNPKIETKWICIQTVIYIVASCQMAQSLSASD